MRDTSRLTYIDASRVTHGDQTLGGLDVQDLTGSPLGLLDALIIDSSNRRIIFFVVEGSGWLRPRRYIVPNAQAQADMSNRTLLVDVVGVKQFAAFDADNFRRFSDEDVINALFPPTAAVA